MTGSSSRTTRSTISWHEAAENFAYAEPEGAADVTGSILQPAGYSSDNGLWPLAARAEPHRDPQERRRAGR